jgi:general secretion pathway protein J
LIELLVAISILAIVAVMGWRGLSSIVRSREILNSELEQTRSLQLTFAQLQSDCAQIINPLNYPNLPEGRSSWIEPTRLILVRNVYGYDQAPTLQVVTYRIKGFDLTRFESITTRDLTILAELLRQARNPPDQQVEIVMQKEVQDIEFSGYPQSSLVGAANADNPISPDKSPNSTENSGVQNVNLNRVTTGLQVSLQLKNHDKNMLKIFVLGGT